MTDTELKNEYRKEADTWKRLYKESQVGLGTLDAQLETALKALENIRDDDGQLAHYLAVQALAQIGTHTKESKPIICIDCDTNEAMPGHYRCLECKAERKDPK